MKRRRDPLACKRLSSRCRLPRMATRRSAAPTLADVAAEAGVRRRPRRARWPTARSSTSDTRRRVWEVGASGCASSPTGSRARCAAARRWRSALSCPTSPRPSTRRALKGAQDVLEAAGYHVLVLNTGRDAAARARGAAHAACAPGRRPARGDLGRLRGHRRAGRVLRQRARPAAAPAPWRSTTTRGIPLLVEHLRRGARPRAHRLCRPAGGRRRGARGRCRAPAASASRRSAPRSGAPGCRSPPEYLRTASPRCSERGARVAARELLALARPPTAIVGGADPLAIGRPARAARRAAVRVPGRRRARLLRRAAVSPTCSIRRSPRSTVTTASSGGCGRGCCSTRCAATDGGAGGDRHACPPRCSMRRSCGCDLTDDDA